MGLPAEAKILLLTPPLPIFAVDLKLGSKTKFLGEQSSFSFYSTSSADYLV